LTDDASKETFEAFLRALQAAGIEIIEPQASEELRAYEDEMMLVNMSVWASLEDLTRYVYASESMHRDVMKQRRRWFHRFDGPYMALWWVPQYHIPTVEEAKERLEHLRAHGDTPYAFTFKKPFQAAVLASDHQDTV